jgi:hypothetical protein
MSIKGKPAAPGTALLLKNTSSAPVIYFDNVPVFGAFSGNLEIELAARLLIPKADGSVVSEMSCAAHLRCSAQAALMLADALTKALDLLSRQQEQPSELLLKN